MSLGRILVVARAHPIPNPFVVLPDSVVMVAGTPRMYAIEHQLLVDEVCVIVLGYAPPHLPIARPKVCLVELSSLLKAFAPDQNGAGDNAIEVHQWNQRITDHSPRKWEAQGLSLDHLALFVYEPTI